MSKFDWRSDAEKAYAKEQGWKVARLDAGLREIAVGSRGLRCTEYASQQIGDMYDHATVYDDVDTGHPIAIIVHPYGQFAQAQVDAIASLYRLQGQIIQPTMYPHPQAQTIVFWRPRPAGRRRR